MRSLIRTSLLHILVIVNTLRDVQQGAAFMIHSTPCHNRVQSSIALIRTSPKSSPAKTHLYSSWNNNNDPWRRQDKDPKFDGIGSTVGGALLGGLVAGPFGALWGASIGANIGAKKAQEAAQKAEMERIGITPEMVAMAMECSVDLSRAMEGLQATESSLQSQQSYARRLDSEAERLHTQAIAALTEMQDEDRARALLSERQIQLDRLKTTLKRCAEEKKRVEIMKANVSALEQRAMEIDTLIRRSVSAKTYQDIQLDNFDDRLALDNEDPLLKKFRELERDG